MSAKSPAKQTKKGSAKKSAPPAHPTYGVMIGAAIAALKNPKGSSKVAIGNYIASNYKVGDRHGVHLKLALKRGLVKGAIVQKSGVGCAGSFKLAAPKAAPKKKVATKKKKPATKKKAVPKKKKVVPKKKKPVAKKAAPKKKAAAPKKKPAAKKPAAKKAKK